MTELFKANNYEVDEEAVKMMYGICNGNVMNLTPERLEEINSNRGDLKRFRGQLKTLKDLTVKKQEIEVAKKDKKFEKEIRTKM